MMEYIITFCPECGPNVNVDEDTCCAMCGNGAMGDSVDELNDKIKQLVSCIGQLNSMVLSGEKHSVLSKAIVAGSLGLFTKPEDPQEECKHGTFEVKRVMDFSFAVCSDCGHQWKL
jgi:hypothetical protein